MFGITSAFLGSGKSNAEVNDKKRKAETDQTEDSKKSRIESEGKSEEVGDNQDATDQNPINMKSLHEDAHVEELQQENVGKSSPSNNNGTETDEMDSIGDDDEEALAENDDPHTSRSEPIPFPPTRDNPYDKLRYCIVQNDGKPDSCVKLIGLKSLFAKQLPKMPRPYIARLVFDRRHTSLAILSDDPQLKGSDEEIIGAICYRGFKEMRFAEIAFCAVNSSHQVKVRSLAYLVPTI